jgi:small subunit ribosomal protein S1
MDGWVRSVSDGEEEDTHTAETIGDVADDDSAVRPSSTEALAEDLVAEWKWAIDERRALLEDRPSLSSQSRIAAPEGYQANAEPPDQVDWVRARRLLDQQGLCEAAVLSHNSGGLVVEFGELQGFVPVSHLVGFPQRASPAERERFLESHVGETLALSVIEVDHTYGRLVLSESEGVRRQREHHRDRLLRELRVGQICRGTVTRLCDFGAFVDLGGADGLVHVSEIAWRRVPHPRDVLQVGQEVEVQVLRLDPARRRIGLSIKQTQPNPWHGIAERFQVGQVVRGTITRVMDFGAFAQVDGGIEGLIHLSELAEGNFMHPRNVVTEGDEVDVMVIRIEPSRHRLGLSLKRVPNSHREAR